VKMKHEKQSLDRLYKADTYVTSVMSMVSSLGLLRWLFLTTIMIFVFFLSVILPYYDSPYTLL
jgi:hypothetical protein